MCCDYSIEIRSFRQRQPQSTQLVVQQAHHQDKVIRTHVDVRQPVAFVYHQPYFLVLGVHEYLEQLPKRHQRVHHQSLAPSGQQVEVPFVQGNLSFGVSHDGLPQFGQSFALLIEKSNGMRLCQEWEGRPYLVGRFRFVGDFALDFEFLEVHADDYTFVHFCYFFFGVDEGVFMLIFFLVVEVEVGRHVGVEYFSTHHFVLIADLKHLDIFAHPFPSPTRQLNKIYDQTNSTPNSYYHQQFTFEASSARLPRRSKMVGWPAHYILQMKTGKEKTDRAITQCRKKNKKEWRIKTQTHQNCLHTEGINLQLSIHYQCTSSQTSQKQEDKLSAQPILALINSRSKTKGSLKSQCLFTASDVLKDEFYLMNLFKNYETAKQRIKNSDHCLSPLQPQRYHHQSRSRFRIIKSKSVPKKILPYGLSTDKKGHSQAQTLKHRMRQLSLQSSEGGQSPGPRMW